MGKLGGSFGWEGSLNVYVCGDSGGWVFRFDQEVSVFWVLAGILGRIGCADGLICGGETSVWWVGSCGLMEWLGMFGFGSLQGGGAGISFVGCCSGIFSEGDDEGGRGLEKITFGSVPLRIPSNLVLISSTSFIIHSTCCSK
jgi:hypothetical protein